MKTIGWILVGLAGAALLGMGIKLYIDETDREAISRECKKENSRKNEDPLEKEMEIYRQVTSEEKAKAVGDKIQETLEDEDFDMSKPINVDLKFDEDGFLVEGNVET